MLLWVLVSNAGKKNAVDHLELVHLQRHNYS